MISMLTGMLEPTDGHVIVAGKDIRTQLGQIRQEIGICLQHDCLFPQLTVRDHIQFFARVKGQYAELSHAEAEEKVDIAIQDVALSEKRDTLSHNLSGGMERKLSVAITFCGDSKTVLLDEPMSGMVRTNIFGQLSLKLTSHPHAHSRMHSRILFLVDSRGMPFDSTARIDCNYVLVSLLATKQCWNPIRVKPKLLSRHPPKGDMICTIRSLCEWCLELSGHSCQFGSIQSTA